MSTMMDDAGMQLPVDVEALLARQREEMAARLGAPGGDYIRIGQDKTFSFPSGETTGDPFEGIILDFQFFNVMYEGQFQRGKPNRAICYANGAMEKDLAPAEDSPEPQAASCAVCPNNQFGSQGAGKACKNKLAIAMLPPDATIDTPIQVLIVPPTSGKHFQKYMRIMTKTAKMNPIQVVSRVGFDPNTSYASPIFEPASHMVDGRRVFEPNPILELCLSRKEEARERLESEKPDTSERPAVAQSGPVRRK